MTIEKRFDWGVEIGFKLEGGIVTNATVYSDALDEAYIIRLPELLKGCPLFQRSWLKGFAKRPLNRICSGLWFRIHGPMA